MMCPSLRFRGLLPACALFLAALQPACGSDEASRSGGDPSTTEEPDGGGVTAPVLPPVDDYGAMGPFATTTILNTGPDGQYTVIRPETLGEDGFLHPPATWGNGITTTPDLYEGLLNTIASHGFVIVASNSTTVNSALMTAGLDWLLAENDGTGDLAGKLDPARAVSIGYSLGGRASVETGKHPNVITTVSFHGLQADPAGLHGPLLLITGTLDDFVAPAVHFDPIFDASAVPTFYGTLIGASHVKPLFDAGDERAPTVAWLRLFVYGDEGARPFFHGADCVLCRDPWTNPRTKNWE